MIEPVEIRLARIEENVKDARGDLVDVRKDLSSLRALLVTFVGIAFAAILSTGGAVFVWLLQK